MGWLAIALMPLGFVIYFFTKKRGKNPGYKEKK